MSKLVPILYISQFQCIKISIDIWEIKRRVGFYICNTRIFLKYILCRNHLFVMIKVSWHSWLPAARIETPQIITRSSNWLLNKNGGKIHVKDIEQKDTYIIDVCISYIIYIYTSFKNLIFNKKKLIIHSF